MCGANTVSMPSSILDFKHSHSARHANNNTKYIVIIIIIKNNQLAFPHSPSFLTIKNK